MKFLSRLLILIITAGWFACTSPLNKKYTSWEVYNGTKEGIKYSSLTQIDTTNVNQLTIAWIYHTGDADTAHASQIQCNPIVVDGTMYGVSPQMKLFAIDAATGEKRWVFDANNTTTFNAN
ncbi:MAG TPA: PQQ-binding-like beta-propeller repeat protein, partial [Saprospiraceae bacterium]|nr:PQQ-binding-like beta-propeller repeat protein [Saprospiraceae bacterium]